MYLWLKGSTAQPKTLTQLYLQEQFKKICQELQQSLCGADTFAPNSAREGTVFSNKELVK